MNYLPVLVWIVRLTFPVVVFWYLWRSKSGRPFVPQLSWGKKRIYQRSYMLCYKPTESSKDPTVTAKLMRLETMEELSKTMPSIRKALTKAKRKTETMQPKNPSSLVVESLINYLAYNAPEKQQFLPETPAPATARSQRASSSFSDGRPHNSRSSQPEAEVVARSNDEAVRILQGALVFKKVSVANRLWKQLTEAEINISETAYSLMVQIAVAARDLDAATDYLLKMESAGNNPPLTLVQSAMSLYSETKKPDSKENVAFGYNPAQSCGYNAALIEGPKCMDKSTDKVGLPLVDGTNKNVDEGAERDGFDLACTSRLSPDAQEFIPGYSYGDGSFMRSRGVRCGVQGHYDY